MTAYAILFGSAFLAATIFPFYSEVILVSLITQKYNLVWLWLVATLGNTLGAGVNWLLGRYLLHFQDRRWFPFKSENLQRSQRWYQKYGVWTLLFAWLPIGGDALPFIAGVMRTRWWIMLGLCGIGKGFRYVIVIWLTVATTDSILQLIF